jgi:hypothetical protein
MYIFSVNFPYVYILYGEARLIIYFLRRNSVSYIFSLQKFHLDKLVACRSPFYKFCYRTAERVTA